MILHVKRAMRGLARFTPVVSTPLAELPDEDYPLVLTTGRVLPQYHAGSMIRRVPGLEWLAPEAIVEIHPADAARYDIVTDELIALRSRRGAIAARARVTSRIRPGTVFVPFHFAEAAANVLTNAALDPDARIPEYKVCAIAVAPGGGRTVRTAEARSRSITERRSRDGTGEMAAEVHATQPVP